MILIALGANLASIYGPPTQTFKAALQALENNSIKIVARSRLYTTPAWPDPSDPPFKNAVIAVETALSVEELLSVLQGIERDSGRERGAGMQNAPRTLDLDLLCYNGLIQNDPQLQLPHPEMHRRGFVLRPLKDVAPTWVHPVLSSSVEEMLVSLSPEQNLENTEGASW